MKSNQSKFKLNDKDKNFFQKHKVWSAVIIVFAVIIIAALALYIYFEAKTSLLQRNNAKFVTSSASSEDDLSSDMAGLQPGKVKEAEGAIFKDSNVYNIMLIGSDERSKEFSTNARGDTCMIMSINKSAGTVKLVSFERGTGMKILDGQYKGQYDWLTHTFEYGGADLMMKEVRESYKIDVTHYVRTNIYTFMELIDSVGGVDVNLTEAEANYINDIASKNGVEANGEKAQTVKVGQNHLNGATAMHYARCRHIDSDWQRVERQRNVIKSSISNMKKLNVIQLNSLFDKVLPLIQTNLSNSDLLNLLTLFPNYKGIEDTTLTIPVKGTYGSMKGMGGRSMFAADFQKNSDTLQEFLYGKK